VPGGTSQAINHKSDCSLVIVVGENTNDGFTKRARLRYCWSLVERLGSPGKQWGMEWGRFSLECID